MNDQETVKTPSLYRIVTAGIGPRISSGLDTHTQEMIQIVKKILTVSALDLDGEGPFWDHLTNEIPIIHWEPCATTPGGISVYLLAKALNKYDMAHFFSEMVSRWLIPGKQATIFSTKQLTFRFVDLPNESFFVAEL